jgi:hypothetical protein
MSVEVADRGRRERIAARTAVVTLTAAGFAVGWAVADGLGFPTTSSVVGALYAAGTFALGRGFVNNTADWVGHLTAMGLLLGLCGCCSWAAPKVREAAERAKYRNDTAPTATRR